MNLKGKTVLITGASSGIGKALAYSLSREGAYLVLAARRIELLEQIKNQIPGNSPLLLLKCDVSKKEEVAESYKRIVERFGSVDIAILNAGAGHYMNAKNYNSAFAEEIYGANLFGVIYWIEQILPEFIKKGNGIIAGVSSLADNRGYSGSSFYSSSKAALTNYLEGLRIELSQYGIKVITIRPGFVETPMTGSNRFHMPFLLKAEKTAEIIIEGIKKGKRIIQFPRPMVWLTNIVGLLPGRLYEFLAEHQTKKSK